MIEIKRAAAYATVQDAGREGFRSSGVPVGGAMDRLSLHYGNALLGNTPGAAAIEWALTGMEVHFRAPAEFVLIGAEVVAHLGDQPCPSRAVIHARRGDLLAVERITTGRFAYLCVAGGIDVPVVLGGRGTYLPGGFGGHQGRRLKIGDMLPLSRLPATQREGAAIVDRRHLRRDDSPLAIMRGPQMEALSRDGWNYLLSHEFEVAPESDRAGYRLGHVEPARSAAADGRSEPACIGAVQLTPKGELIVLMPDGPTVGGYPKIGVLAAADLPRLAQTAAGELVRFRLVEPEEAVQKLAAQQRMLRQMSGLTARDTAQ